MYFFCVYLKKMTRQTVKTDRIWNTEMSDYSRLLLLDFILYKREFLIFLYFLGPWSSVRSIYRHFLQKIIFIKYFSLLLCSFWFDYIYNFTPSRISGKNCFKKVWNKLWNVYYWKKWSLLHSYSFLCLSNISKMIMVL